MMCERAELNADMQSEEEERPPKSETAVCRSPSSSADTDAALDLFKEHCSTLYNRILDQLNDDGSDGRLESAPPSLYASLEAMAAEVEAAGRRISRTDQALEGVVQLHVHTISSALGQLRLRRTTSDCDSTGSRSAPFSEIRAWIHGVEGKLEAIERRYKAAASGSASGDGLTKLLADQQVLQLEIQTEGQALISRLDSIINRCGGSSDGVFSSRRQHCVEGIRKRWLTIYLNSLSLLCRIEECVARRRSEDVESDGDPEVAAPPAKRARVSRRRGAELISEGENDDEEEVRCLTNSPPPLHRRLVVQTTTTTTTSDECCFSMDDAATRAATATSGSVDDDGEHRLRVSGESGSSQASPEVRRAVTTGGEADIGYSSGENSVHEAVTIPAGEGEGGGEGGEREESDKEVTASVHPILGTRRARQAAIVEPNSYGARPPLDLDCSFLKLPFEQATMTDSLIVNFETPRKNSPEYEEVMALLNEDEESATAACLLQTEGTRWKEMPRGLPTGVGGATRAAGRNGTRFEDVKHSSDASSEESSDCEDAGNALALSASCYGSTGNGRPITLAPMLSLSMHSSYSSELMAGLQMSLKRPRGGSGSRGGMMNCSQLFSSEMEASFCSTRSEQARMQTGGGGGRSRRKLRPRRMPRSMSDGEQLAATTAAAGTHVFGFPPLSASSPTPRQSASRLLSRLDADLALSGAEAEDGAAAETARRWRRQREKQRAAEGGEHPESAGEGDEEELAAYEWDEYHPPAKDESSDLWCLSRSATHPPPEHRLHNPPLATSTPQRSATQLRDASRLHFSNSNASAISMDCRGADELLSVDEDFQSHFGDKDAIQRLIEESRANLAVVRAHLAAADVDELAMSTVSLIARTNIRHLQEALKTHLPHNIAQLGELEDVMNEWKAVASPLPQIANKVERFAHSLRALDEGCAASLSGLPSGGIQSKEQARAALAALESIHERFRQERSELKCLLESPSVKKELCGMEREFDSLSSGYDDAVERMETLVRAVRKLNDEWNDWADQQKAMRDLMQSIECRLRDGEVDVPAVTREMELCQERMNSLETMCNYLTVHLAALQEEGGQAKAAGGGGNGAAPDFGAEISLYANALEQLKARINDALAAASGRGVLCMDGAERERESAENEEGGVRRRRAREEEAMEIDETVSQSHPPRSLIKTVVHTVRRSRTTQFLFLLSALCAIAALLASGVLTTPLGPHLEYVRGPPPV